jgi:GTP-binding protein
MVRAELEAYGHGLVDKPEIVALNKVDALTPEQVERQTAELKRAARQTPFVVSAVSGQGVQRVLRALMQIIDKTRGGATTKHAAGAAWQP